MRFSVECAFPHLGKRGAASRKSTLCSLRLTERRTLQPASHGKAHSATYTSRKGALCDPQIAQNVLFRHVAAPGRCGATPPARLRGTMENGSTGQMRSSNPPPACGAACARVRRSRFEFDLTEKRTLVPAPHAQAHSAACPVPLPASADPPHHGSGVCAIAQVVSFSDSVAYGVVAKFGTKLLSQRMDVHPHRVAEQIYVAVPGVGEQLLAADRSPAVT